LGCTDYPILINVDCFPVLFLFFLSLTVHHCDLYISCVLFHGIRLIDAGNLQSLISTQSRLVITSSESDLSADSVLCSEALCIEVPTDDIRAGDSVLVLPGETIPVDVSV